MPRPSLLTLILAGALTCVTGDSPIRLVNGYNVCSGRVEIRYNGQWGTVCDDSWDMNEAAVVCRQLGCGGAVEAHQSAHFGPGTGRIWLDDVRCSGSELTLTQCSHPPFGEENCGHHEDAGVVCSKGAIRLVNGSDSCSGRVEIRYNGQWGTVCDDSWDMNEAAVVCRQLGCGEAVNAHQNAHFGPGTGRIWLDDVVCSGSELTLTQCSHRRFGENNCGHSEDAGVVCSKAIRLVSGADSCCGRVEIHYNGQWGTVCDDDWDMNDAAVVCRELGCGSAVSAPHGAVFGQGTGQIWLDDVRCSGSQRSLIQCSHSGLGKHDCNHGKDAGVVCSGGLGFSPQRPTLSLNSPHSTVSPGENVQFRCTTSKPRCSVNVEFQLFINGSFKSSQTHQSTVTFSLVIVDESHQGTYSCHYTYKNSSIMSPSSNTVIITVVHLKQPRISSPDGGFDVSLQDPVITRGHSFTIICSTRSRHPGGSFHLFRGSEVTRTQSAHRLSSSFIFPEADYSHEGNYTCVYEVTVSSRTFRSPASEPLLITITAALLPVIGAVVSVLLLLLSVLIIVLLLKRRQKQRNKEGHLKCSFRKGASNTYAGASNGNRNEDDDEDDYENVEFNDKKMDDGDSEDDYVNADKDDSEEDYVNVNDIKKSVVDQSDENIYEGYCDEY